MKKRIFLGLIALTLSTQAYYDDYMYKHHLKKGFEFGFDLGYQQDFGYKDKIKISGISSRYVYEIGRTGMNIGVTALAHYQSKHPLETNEYNIDISARVGSDHFIKNLNTYFGSGFGGLKSIDKTFIDLGVDYYYSSDLIFNANFRSYKELTGNKNTSSRINLGITIPFNSY